MVARVTVRFSGLVSPPPSIVVSGLKEINSVMTHEVHDPVFLGQPSRPSAGCQMLERLGLADAGERITKDGLHKIQRPEGYLPIRFYPEPKIFAELRLKDRNPWLLRDSGAALSLAQARAPCGGV